MTPLEKRAERKARNHNGLDMNLVALIDIFTILLFFLLSSATEMETLVIPRAVHLPESLADTTPRVSTVVLVNEREIVVDGRTVALVADVMADGSGDLIAPLQAELAQVRAQPDASPTVTIMGDKDIPYRLLRKVMSTCAQAEFTDVAFAVRTRLEAKT
jgi:biopolymer transport protein TolR